MDAEADGSAQPSSAVESTQMPDQEPRSACARVEDHLVGPELARLLQADSELGETVGEGDVAADVGDAVGDVAADVGDELDPRRGRVVQFAERIQKSYKKEVYFAWLEYHLTERAIRREDAEEEAERAAREEPERAARAKPKSKSKGKARPNMASPHSEMPPEIKTERRSWQTLLRQRARDVKVEPALMECVFLPRACRETRLVAGLDRV